MADWSTSGIILTLIVVVTLPLVAFYSCYCFIKAYAEDRRDRIAEANQEKESLRMAGLSGTDDDSTISESV